MDKIWVISYWLSTARIVNNQLFDKYVSKVIPWPKKVNVEVFAKDKEPQGKEQKEDSSLVFMNFHQWGQQFRLMSLKI